LKRRSKVGELLIEVAGNNRHTIMGVNLRVGKHRDGCGSKKEGRMLNFGSGN
jgi:hypothetical protein